MWREYDDYIIGATYRSGYASPYEGRSLADGGSAMAFKLLEVVQAHWRRLDSAEFIPLVRAHVRFVARAAA